VGSFGSIDSIDSVQFEQASSPRNFQSKTVVVGVGDFRGDRGDGAGVGVIGFPERLGGAGEDVGGAFDGLSCGARGVETRDPYPVVRSFRLFTSDTTLGAPNVYAEHPNAFDGTSEGMGYVLAAHAAVA